MIKVFIDGSAGTTGLRIHERLSARNDLELITLSEAVRKDPSARRDALNSADVAFLCLPDDAAREAVSMITSDTAVIDTSTAHRTAPGWVYGFPEIGGRRALIRQSKRIANPGCHAGGFISLVAPLTEKGLLQADSVLDCYSITGYSGGGKKMIAQYECDEPDPLYAAPRTYGLTQKHKHLPEMQAICGLTTSPVFCPIVSNFYSGMETTVMLHKEQVKGTLSDIRELYREYYRNEPMVHYSEDDSESGFLSAAAYEDRDDMEITAVGNDDRFLLVSRFNNLGKGASGAAIQNMNILLGIEETTGLTLK